MGKWGILVAVLTLMVSGAAMAQRASGVSDTASSITASTTSGNCLASNASRKTLTLDNIAGTINVGYCETSASAPATPCTAVIGTPPTTTLASGSLHYFSPAPVNQFCFISASSTQAITIREGQ
jgi:hypothetical protein